MTVFLLGHTPGFLSYRPLVGLFDEIRLWTGFPKFSLQRAHRSINLVAQISKVSAKTILDFLSNPPSNPGIIQDTPR